MVVRSRTHFAERLHIIASMPATVVREGRLLYDSGEDGCNVRPIDKAKDTADWTRKAGGDLRTAEAILRLDPPEIGNALYYCQQAVEKAMKALLYWQDVPVRKTHKLDELGKPCVERDPSLGALFSRAAKLSNYVFLFRYPGIEDLEIDQAQEGLALAREVYDAVAKRFPVEAIGA